MYMIIKMMRRHSMKQFYVIGILTKSSLFRTLCKIAMCYSHTHSFNVTMDL